MPWKDLDSPMQRESPILIRLSTNGRRLNINKLFGAVADKKLRDPNQNGQTIGTSKGEHIANFCSKIMKDQWEDHFNHSPRYFLTLTALYINNFEHHPP